MSDEFVDIHIVDLFDPSSEDAKEKPKKKFVEYPKDANGNTIWPKQKQRGPKKNPYISYTDEGELVPLTDVQRGKLERSALNSCIWHLEQSNKTKKQLRDKLIIKEIPEDIIEKTLDHLETLGYINDKSYSESFVRSKQSYSGLGKGGIRQALRQKGITTEIIDETIENISDEDEYERAKALVMKKMPSTKKLDPQKRFNRLVGMLSRKGYGGNIVFTVIKECIEDEKLAEEITEDDFLE